jgi:NAD(P)H-dependent flavin oxidoreductase YrpB (nitropropane dioxygenase family)
MTTQPLIIQGGMGVAVSGWLLARTISQLGHLGVVSGTALAVTVARRLQLGDPDGSLRHALSHFPVPGVADRVMATYFSPVPKVRTAAYRSTPMPVLRPGTDFLELTVLANFVEVFLAKEGHRGVVGVNLLEKIQLPTLPSLFGAMLAGVDYVLMGAGIPRAIPGALDRLARGEPAELKMDVNGALPGEEFCSTFDPRAFMGDAAMPELKRPDFLGIVSSATLAMTLARKSSGRVDGFVVEGDTAGGHNAPPRGPLQLNDVGEPVYGPRDVPDLEKIRLLGLPFWLAGSYGRPGRLRDALAVGATGIQVGTAFAFCEESGISPEIKDHAIALSLGGTARVFTDPVASPTGFPFKVVQLEGTMSQPEGYARRERICDLGYLRHLYRRADGSVGYRCPSEPVEDYVRKGGALEDTVGRKCVCNGLPATVGLGQERADGENSELPLVTAGNDVADIAQFLGAGRVSYSAAEVIRALMGEVGQGQAPPGEPFQARQATAVIV